LETNSQMEFLTIDDWVNQVAAIQEKEFTRTRIGAFIARHGIRPDTLCPHAFYASQYTRNLIYKCDLFEVVAICWDIGQMSPPHDHGGQKCWMLTPTGQLRVRNFHVDERDEVQGTCRLTLTSSFDIDVSHPSHVEPEESVHQVSNLAEFGARAMSVHVYSRPYSSCEVYDTEKGAYSTRTLSYWSEYGQLVRCS
jgi:cysteine dioxygenase